MICLLYICYFVEFYFFSRQVPETINLSVPLGHINFNSIAWAEPDPAENIDLEESFDMLEAALPEGTELPLPPGYFIYTVQTLI